MKLDKVSFSQLRPEYIISGIIGILAIAESVGGLLLDNLYQDNPLVVSGWYGNDLVTLLVALPLLFVSLFLESS